MNARKEPKMTVRFGDRAKDRVTGFEGIVAKQDETFDGLSRDEICGLVRKEKEQE